MVRSRRKLPPQHSPELAKNPPNNAPHRLRHNAKRDMRSHLALALPARLLARLSRKSKRRQRSLMRQRQQRHPKPNSILCCRRGKILRSNAISRSSHRTKAPMDRLSRCLPMCHHQLMASNLLLQHRWRLWLAMRPRRINPLHQRLRRCSDKPSNQTRQQPFGHRLLPRDR